MNAASLICSKCRAPLGGELFNLGELRPCPACAAPLQADVFPALFRAQSVGALGETIVTEGEASCFFHPQKRAVVPCEGCGRFVCALCDVELNGQHLCPTCLNLGKTKGKLRSLENHRVLYDRAALLCATLPLLIGLWPSIAGAPISLYLCIRYWKEPGDYVRPGKWRFIVAGTLAVMEIIAWISVVILFVSK